MVENVDAKNKILADNLSSMEATHSAQLEKLKRNMSVLELQNKKLLA